MRRDQVSRFIYRVIDANTNRLKEGLRVCEEITRFILNNRALTVSFKNIRHQVDDIIQSKTCLLQKRDSCGDVGRKITTESEAKRVNYQDIFFANIQRVKESLRVLEEFTKLEGVKASLKFKKLRYKIYELEKKAYLKLNYKKNDPAGIRKK